MELRHLRYFVAVARHLSFTAAAETLGISQPPLSQQIRDLEAEIGTYLFVRTSRRVVLTQAGRDLLENAVAILDKADESIARARAIGRGSAGIIHIGLTGSILAGPLGRLILAFREDNPAVDLRLREMSPNRQLLALRERRIDVAFLRSPPGDGEFMTERAWREDLVMALPGDHALAGAAAIRIADLRAEAFVFFDLGDSQFAVEIAEACARHGFAPRIGQQVVEATSLVSLVAAGHGVAVVPEFVGLLAHTGVAYRPLTDAGRLADAYALRRADSGPVVEHFLALVRDRAEAVAEGLRRPPP